MNINIYTFFSGFATLTDILFENISKFKYTSTFKLLALENIAFQFGCDFLLEKFPNLPKELLNLTSQPTICEQVTITITQFCKGLIIFEVIFKSTNLKPILCVTIDSNVLLDKILFFGRCLYFKKS